MSALTNNIKRKSYLKKFETDNSTFGMNSNVGMYYASDNTLAYSEALITLTNYYLLIQHVCYYTAFKDAFCTFYSIPSDNVSVVYVGPISEINKQFAICCVNEHDRITSNDY